MTVRVRWRPTDARYQTRLGWHGWGYGRYGVFEYWRLGPLQLRLYGRW